jgi:DNA sulfur modification protein DndD
MLIDKITLRNYRVYQGDNTVTFDYDHSRNVTIISGNNGFGKTSFLTSLIWCLYGKLMADVDEKYRKEIFEAGGYKKYCDRTLNRNFLQQYSETFVTYTPSFSVTVVLSKVSIPGIPCDNVSITRTHNIATSDETLVILMDEKENELTTEMGPEIFINDFILPREIAKFFFFDAEKIVSLAEMRSLEEKKMLSKAYAEVLGIKKYEDLRQNLENVRLKLRKSTTGTKDQQKLQELDTAIHTNERLLPVCTEKRETLKEDIARKKVESEKLQERLIREGSSLTTKEFIELKQSREHAAIENERLKNKVNELLDIAPLAIASHKLSMVYHQMMREAEVREQKSIQSSMKRKLDKIREDIKAQRKALNIAAKDEPQLFALLEKHLLPTPGVPATTKLLLNFNPDEWNKLLALVDNLGLAYGKEIKDTSQRLKISQSSYAINNSKLKDAEIKENDLVIQELRSEKEKCDAELLLLEKELIGIEVKLVQLSNELANLLKQQSELKKKVKVNEYDELKDMHAARLIKELTVFTQNLKKQKKKSLEANILAALHKLMHKADFIHSVEVIVENDFIDIELYDRHGKQINKEGMSKGEQQLYATSILKALVDESNIRFPLFIDSPLQKFDKQHAHNIITEFYPAISEQVVLFPLLEKELSNDEYTLLLQRVNKAYLIQHIGQYQSQLTEVQPELLFEPINALA